MLFLPPEGRSLTVQDLDPGVQIDRFGLPVQACRELARSGKDAVRLTATSLSVTLSYDNR
jgi:hypothetical protein